MPMYRQQPPGQLVKGTIVGVSNRNTANPRYTVRLRDTNHPVPVNIYAWASPDQFHQSAAIQHELDEEVEVVNIGGRASIVKNEPRGYGFPPVSSMSYGGVRVVVTEFGLLAADTQGGLNVVPGGAAAYHTDGGRSFSPERSHVVEVQSAGPQIIGGDVEFGHLFLGRQRAPLSSWAAGPHIQGQPTYHPVVVEPSGTGSVPDLTMVPITMPAQTGVAVDGTIRIPSGGMAQSFRASINIPEINFDIDLSNRFAYGDSVNIAASGLSDAPQLMKPALAAPQLGAAPPGATIQLNISWPSGIDSRVQTPVILFYGVRAEIVGEDDVAALFGTGPAPGVPIGAFRYLGEYRPTGLPTAGQTIPATVLGSPALSVAVSGYLLISSRAVVQRQPALPPIALATTAYYMASSTNYNLRFGALTVGNQGNQLYTISEAELTLGYTPPAGQAVNYVALQGYKCVILDGATGAQASQYSLPMITVAYVGYDSDPVNPSDRPTILATRP